MSSGIAYLVRRLDENTAPENFLRASFGMRPGDASFERERSRFREALEAMDSLDETPRREREMPRVHGERFVNEPDTDFARVAPRVAVRAELLSALAQAPPTLVSRVAGEDCSLREQRAGTDPSRPSAVPYYVALANEADVERALWCASADHSGWAARPPE